MIKLIVSDIDGTLLNDAKEFAPDFFENLEKLQKENVKFVAASGRSQYTLEKVFHPFERDIIYISDNGGYIKGNNFEKVIMPMTEAQVHSTVETCLNVNGLQVIMCAKDRAYFVCPDMEYIPVISHYYINYEIIDDYRKVNEILNGFDESVANGKSAFFAGIKGIENVFGGKMFINEVVCNMEKLPAAIFHEIGHAFNANNSTFWRTVQKMKKHSLPIAGYIALYCALTKKAVPKKEGNMELTKGQKVKNFIRENSGKLAFIATLPMLIEEGMASIRGNDWAKEFLSPDLAKKVSKHNKFAYITYLATAAGFALSAYAARKVKDYFVDKKNAV